MTFTEIYRRRSLILSYCPSCETGIRVSYRGQERYFNDLHYAVDYAKRRGWIADDAASVMASEAAREIRRLDLLQDRVEDRLHERTMRARDISSAFSSGRWGTLWSMVGGKR